MSNSLRVMTYNIFDGGGGRADLIAAVIAASRADIVLLNEADDPAVVARLGDELRMEQVWGRGSGAKHIALLSRLRILDWRVHNQRPITQALLEAQIRLDTSHTLTIYGVHLLPYFMLLPYEFARWRTIAAILRLIHSRGEAAHLLLGDFNAVAPGESADLALFPPKVQRLMRLQANRFARIALRPLARARYTDVFRALHPLAPGRTWTPARPSARLDYVFADATMAPHARACQVLTDAPASRASDHFPLVAEFEVTNG